MRKNIMKRSNIIDQNSDRIVNRKRSQRWLSDETKLLNKYGFGSRRYESLYML